MTSSKEDKAKVWDLVKDMKIAMLTTLSNGRMHARPMASVQKDFDGPLWFMSRADSLKIDEIEKDPKVLLVYAHAPAQHYVTINGTARVVRERAKIHELWSEADRVWFPQGPDDPAIALLAVDVEQAEYWDAPTSAMVVAFAYAKARIAGEAPDLGEHKIVTV